MKDLFDESVGYVVINQDNPYSQLAGNPQVIGSSSDTMVIKRGSKYYALLKKGEPLSSIKHWDKLSNLKIDDNFVLF